MLLHPQLSRVVAFARQTTTNTIKSTKPTVSSPFFLWRHFSSFSQHHTTNNNNNITNNCYNLRRELSTTATSSTNKYEDKTGEIYLSKLTGSDVGIRVMTLNRGSVKNALGKGVVHLLRSILNDLLFDKDARVLIIDSAVPGVFCAGADLKERVTMNTTEVAQFVHSLRFIFSELEGLPIPTIAAIDGIALGGGLELALACDFRIASADSRVGLTETGLAIIPGAGGTQRLPRLIGAARAKELIFTAEIISGTKAHEFGIVQHVVEAGKSLDKALDIARKILTKGPIAIKMAKKAIDKGMAVDPTTGLFIEQACYASVIPTKDRLEGLAAFKEKRTPQYTGE